MDRPAELERCIQSILAGSRMPEEIVVSDDSCNPEPIRRLCESYALVRYVPGPRAGQGANRGAGVLACRGDYVSFMDDDAIMPADFLEVMFSQAKVADGKTILTGDLVDQGIRISPTNLTFWGYFGAPVRDRLENVIFSSNLFPISVFRVSVFDRHLRYGYEDADFCAQALAEGYWIKHVPTAYTIHLPSQINRAASSRFTEESRYYTSLKRLLLIRRQWWLALIYLISCPLRDSFYLLKRRRIGSVFQVYKDLRVALEYLLDEISMRRMQGRNGSLNP